MVAGNIPPFFMETPALKYYFPTPICLKLRLYITKTHIQQICLETTSYKGLECLFYIKADPSQKPVLKFVNEILDWLLCYAKKQPQVSYPCIKLPQTQEDSKLIEALSSLKFGSFVTEAQLLDKLGLNHLNFNSWMKTNPFTPFIPIHRVLPSKKSELPSNMTKLLNTLRSFEELSV
jgi:O6-methylguanine-DNA--protein-cysteine methyltransferase